MLASLRKICWRCVLDEVVQDFNGLKPMPLNCTINHFESLSNECVEAYGIYSNSDLLSEK